MTTLSFTDFRNNMANSFDLAAKIEKARKEYREDKIVSLKSHEDIDKYFNSID